MRATITSLVHYGAVVAAALAAACASTAGPVANVPQNLQPGAAEKQVLVTAATGVQIYQCRAASAGAEPEWTFVAPEAELLDRRGAKLGIHYAGPHWESPDGSKVAASVAARADAPATGAIPWLLLNARSVGTHGVFSKVSSIQRVNTAGGTAPRSGCSRANAGALARIPYTADYVFFARQS
ncbi:MAG: DUF3455 domain-containing protein [Ramlibacter sp.]